VGLKGMAEEAKAQGLSQQDLFAASRLVTSLLIGFLVGMAAIMMLGVDTSKITFSMLLGIAAAGYSGTDVLEGFIAKYLPSTPAENPLNALMALTTRLAASAPAAAAAARKRSHTYTQARKILVQVFAERGATDIELKDSRTLDELGFTQVLNLYGLLASINAHLDDAHKLGSSAVSGWETIKDVIASIEYA
jgi:hypothetical protein